MIFAVWLMTIFSLISYAIVKMAQGYGGQDEDFLGK
jgi:hypothetical protein